MLNQQTMLESSRREHDEERTEKEEARFHLSQVLKAIKGCPNHVVFFVTSTREFEAADAYLNPPVKKPPYANDDEGKI
jgi:hypothetical protein